MSKYDQEIQTALDALDTALVALDPGVSASCWVSVRITLLNLRYKLDAETKVSVDELPEVVKPIKPQAVKKPKAVEPNPEIITAPKNIETLRAQHGALVYEFRCSKCGAEPWHACRKVDDRGPGKAPVGAFMKRGHYHAERHAAKEEAKNAQA